MTTDDRRLVYVTTAGCAVCKEKTPLVEELATETGLPLERVDSDTEEGAARAEELRVRGVPTLALIQGERVPFRLLGLMITRENVEHFLARD
ncbi:MAG TPA: thioredoxin family protein [Gemmatimonadaceae bacterium]|nr:thioredoxin family protein [Gemmatimonadaceae bacterium]